MNYLGAENQGRTGDLPLFRRALYQLSYLGMCQTLYHGIWKTQTGAMRVIYSFAPLKIFLRFEGRERLSASIDLIVFVRVS